MDLFENENAAESQIDPQQTPIEPAESAAEPVTVSQQAEHPALQDEAGLIEPQPVEFSEAAEDAEQDAGLCDCALQDEKTDSVAPASKKGVLRKIFLCLVSVVLILAILAGSNFVTAIYLSRRWESDLNQVSAQYDAQIQAMQQDLKAGLADISIGSGVSVSGSPAPVGEGMTPSEVYANNVKSVVMIYAEVSTSVFGQVSKSTSTGSGFVLTEAGHIVTNYHVVENATALSIILYDGTQIEAQLIGADSSNDIALLKVEHDGLKAVKIGSSDRLIVGDQVVAIGNPLGELTSTLTVGYVSAKERDVNTDGTVINMIQTDAAINSGNSGGPLFNMLGEVVGITTAKYSGTSNSGATIEGIGFAIPIDDVYDMLDDLKNFGYITGAYLGVEVSDTDPDAAAYFGYPVGAYVHSVEKGSCAQKAGIMAKDIIIEMGGYEVGSLNDLSRALRQFNAGDETTIVVYRLGQEIALEITLDAKPQSMSTP